MHLPAGNAADGPYAVDVDPRAGRLGLLQPAGAGAGARRLAHLRHRRQRVDRAAAERRLHGAHDDGRDLRTPGQGERVQRGHATSRTCPATPTPRSPPAREAASPWQERSASADSPPATAPRRRSPSSSAAAATAPARCNNFARRRRLRVRQAHRRRGDHPGRQLVLVSRRTSTTSTGPARSRELEEIYYFEFADGPRHAASATSGSPPRGHGRTPTCSPRSATGDAVLIPDGWHGPSIAAPGHDMYYLNVMAGPGDERAWLICYHPDHAWIRDTWPDQPVDPRLPLYTAPESAR